MIVDNQLDYTLITPDEDTFEHFYQNFTEQYSILEEKHLIIQLYTKFNIAERDILVFLEYAEKHQHHNKSFIIVCNKVDVDQFPDTFNVVPTLQEANDVLEMENIERDLGF